MNRSLGVRRMWGGVRVAGALLVLVAVVAQLVTGRNRPSFRTTNFFSFFTIESNVIAALVLGVTGVLWIRGRSVSFLSSVRGAATLYMTTTGVVYVLLLSGLEESLQIATPWVNAVLHYVMPVLTLADWLVDRTVRPLAFRTALWWLVFPVAYLVYSLIRGPIVGWYPYPFLDPRPHGYGPVAMTSAGIAVFSLLLAWGLAATTRIARPARARAVAV